jgi:hypothetical protein
VINSTKSCFTKSVAALVATQLLNHYCDKSNSGGKASKLAIANKLAILQKIKQEKGVLFRSFSNDLTEQMKCEKLKEVTELAKSPGRAAAEVSRHPLVKLVKEDIGE